MPIEPAIAARLHLLDGIPSLAAAFADAELRSRVDEFFQPATSSAPPSVRTEERQLPGPHGPIRVRLYHPDGSHPDGSHPDGGGLPGFVWLHGGGFQAGDLEMPEADWTAREVCSQASAVVVSVDYRLAVGGVHYPVPLDDVVAAISWVRTNAGALGVDPDRISVGGASAGATLAAGATLRLRDDEQWQPAALVLAYPVLHPAAVAASAALAENLQQVPQLLRFLPGDIDRITRNYLGGPPSTATGYAMPALATLDGLAPVLVLNAEYDDLRASGEAFAAALATASVDVAQVLVRGYLHGFLNMGREHAGVSHALDLIAGVVTGSRRLAAP